MSFIQVTAYRLTRLYLGMCVCVCVCVEVGQISVKNFPFHINVITDITSVPILVLSPFLGQTFSC